MWPGDGDSLGVRTAALLVASTICTQEEKKKERKNNAAAFNGMGFLDICVMAVNHGAGVLKLAEVQPLPLSL